MSRPGRYQTVAENLKVKEVIFHDGDRRRRYLLCYISQDAWLMLADKWDAQGNQ